MSSGVTWQKCSPGSRSEVLRVRTVKPGERVVVAFLGEEGDIAETKVHYVRDGDKSQGRPCLGETCPYCPEPAQPRRYAPVLHFVLPLPRGASTWTPPPHFCNYSETCWERCVLEMTLSWFHIVEVARRGSVFDLCRPSINKQGRVHWRELGIMTLPKGLSFDPRPVIERAWGIRKAGNA